MDEILEIISRREDEAAVEAAKMSIFEMDSIKIDREMSDTIKYQAIERGTK